MTFAIVGAGPTGVELAGQIRELAFRSLQGLPAHRSRRRAGHPDRRRQGAPGQLRGPAVRRAAKELEKMGVELRMGLRVVGVDALGVDTQSADGEKGRFDCGTTIWAAGVQASPWRIWPTPPAPRPTAPAASLCCQT